MSDQEIELKLRVAPEDLPRLKELPPLAGARATSKQLESVYFDTPDLRLRGRAVTLRVRRSGSRFLQTVKSAPGAAGTALVRSEWEVPVGGPDPDLSALPAEALAALGPLDAAEVRPVFASHVKRSVRVIGAGDGTEVEVAVDQGELRTPDGRTLPLAEIELELKRGTDTRALYDLALALNEALPLRIEPRAKSDRGYDLAAGTRVTWSKAGSLELSPDETVEEALGGIVRHCLDHLVANEACALAGNEPEGIHQMRVALRRLRSALSTFRDVIPGPQAAVLGPEVKWLADAFGPARDWDVFLTETMAPAAEAFPGDPALAALSAAGERARAQGYVRAREAILSPRYTALLLKLGAWVDGRGWRDQAVSEQSSRLFEPVTGFADAMLAKRHRQARKRGRHFARLDAEARHQLRITLKKLRYAAEFFRALYPAKPVRRYLKELAALQEALGHLNDVATVAKLVRQLEAEPEAPAGWSLGAGIVLGWRARGLADLEPELVRDWEAFADAEPFWTAATAAGNRD